MVTIVIVAALIVCTILTVIISESMRHRVAVTLSTVIFMEINGEEDFCRFVPDSAVLKAGISSCVYVVRDERGLFDDESHLVLCEVSVLMQMDGMTAYGGSYMRKQDRVVVHPNPEWEDGDAVKITNLAEIEELELQ